MLLHLCRNHGGGEAVPDSSITEIHPEPFYA